MTRNEIIAALTEYVDFTVVSADDDNFTVLTDDIAEWHVATAVFAAFDIPFAHTAHNTAIIFA
jgi:hypothetical protein